MAKMKKLPLEIKWLLRIHNFMLFMGVFFYLVYRFIFVPKLIINSNVSFFRNLQIVVIAALSIAYYIAIVWFNKQLVLVKNIDLLVQKLNKYKAISAVKFATIFVSIIVIASAYIVTQEIIFAILFWCVALWFFSQRPHPILAAAHLGINKEDLFYTVD